MTVMRSALFLLLVTLLGPSTDSFAQAGLSDDQIKQELISQSRAAYSGVCACPYDRMRNGRSCGTRSAYSRPGGASPICYKADVTQDMITRYRQRLSRNGLSS